MIREGAGFRELPPAAIVPEPGTSLKNKTGSWRIFRPVVDREKCSKCRICWLLCPEGCKIELEDCFETDLDYCKGCGICAQECPYKAIEMVLEEGSSIA